jgi:hypothetical protein
MGATNEEKLPNIILHMLYLLKLKVVGTISNTKKEENTLA